MVIPGSITRMPCTCFPAVCPLISLLGRGKKKGWQFMTPINTVGWMCWQYVNNYFCQDPNSIVWVSVGWLILPEDRYVWPEFYDRCQIYRNVVWGRSSYWQSNEKPVGRLMLKLNRVVPPSLCVFDKWCWSRREGVILCLVWAKSGRSLEEQ